MASGIYLRREGKLVHMDEQAYSDEAELQELLGTHPDLLSADGQPRRWLLISREFGIASEQDGSDRWSVDHLFIDEQAIPTLVEVKRSTDTRIRREVVGQMLDYAANALSHWNVDSIRARFEAQCVEAPPEEELARALGDDIDVDKFWQQVETNLAAGRVRLMFVADIIPAELRAIVEFLNQHMSQVEVLAVEVKQYMGETPGHQTLVSRLIGQTQAARRTKGPSERVAWDRSSWLESYREARGDSETSIVERLFEWADQHQPPIEISFGSSRGSAAKAHMPDVVRAFNIWPTYGYIDIPFQALAKTPPFESVESRRELQAELTKIPGVAFPDDRLDKFPSVPVQSLRDDFAYHCFTETIEQIVRSALTAAAER